ncbi:zinc-binding dehydrogenase [Defluviitalea saccharophila]|uniref:Zinc-binding dehydrogenase n=1 Tax=Defluviitalea saccharophila TaxID=879970 RepID=A0ABZ2Y4X9_9FIRM|nr:zinc-binding dehydrogenase [Candidatus Epulonipiscium sp.]
MKTRAVRLYGVNDLRLEEFELPEIKDDEILAQVISDSVCMSTYKAVIQGKKHKRVPDDIDVNPTIMGHEFAGIIVQVGAKWQDQFKPGDKFAIQPALNYKGSPYAPGYSYRFFGGNTTYTIIPPEVMELGYLLKYEGKGFYEASLAEPMSCIIGGFHANYHTETGKYVHHMGIVEGGKTAILAGAGPMGLGAIDYALHCDRRPSLLVVTDIDDNRLKRAEQLFPPEEAKKDGIDLIFVNTKNLDDPAKYLIDLTGGTGYDDVFVYAPVRALVEQGDKILGKDGCMNFFAGPTDTEFKAEVNFYNIHYTPTHIMGSTGGNADDMLESLRMSAQGLINPAVMVTHVGGLNCVADTILNLPNIPGGKKLTYSNVDMELTAIEDFAEKGKTDPFFAELAKIVEKHNGLWSAEAEAYLLEHKSIQ